MLRNRVTRRHVPAALLLLVGLALAVSAGVALADQSREQYDYSVTAFDGGDTWYYQGIHRYERLSDPGRTVVDRARNATAEEIAVPDALASAPEFATDGGSSLIAVDGGYLCLDVPYTDAAGPPPVEVDPDCVAHVDGPVVHEFASLSPTAQAVVERGLADDDGEFTRYGDHPPEFEPASDAPDLNRGIYNVRFDGAYYQVTVFSQGGFGAAILRVLLAGGVAIGLLLAGVGLASLPRPRVRTPTALLAGVVTVGAPVGLATAGLLSRSVVGAHLDVLGLVGVLTSAAVWGLLYGLDVE